MTENKIDIIVPCYKAHKFLPRLLGSVLCQTILDDLEVTLVNDADDEDYKAIVKLFSPLLKIKEVKMKENGGPAVARQFGYDNTSNPFVTWIDADDTFSGAFALEILREQMLEEKENVVCIGSFAQENDKEDCKKHDAPRFIAHGYDTVWMFGKLYKREFLDKYKIRFNETRANEDTGFNMVCKLLSNERERIKFIGDNIYFWHTNPNSITRINNCQYSYDQSFVGYTDNMIWALREAEERNPFGPDILKEKVAIMLNLYEYWIETVERDSRFIEQNWNSCKKYYKEIYKEISHKIPDKALAEFYNNVMAGAYAQNKLVGIIPCMGIKEFLDKLEKETSEVQNAEVC